MSRISGLNSPFLLGFDDIERLLDRISRSPSNGYPPYNIERLPANGNRPESLRIVIAVAGFSAEDLEVTVEQSQLIIRGRQGENGERDYLHQGIAARQFQRSFVLADGMEVTGAQLENGLLRITLSRPEPKREARRIAIRSSERDAPASEK